MNHEEAIVQAFIIPVRQERHLGFLKNSKNRKKFIDQLAHFKHLNLEFAVDLRGNQRSAAGIYDLLRAKGAGAKCWVMSENAELDGRELELQTALKETVGARWAPSFPVFLEN
jgi:hypothetical protein